MASRRRAKAPPKAAKPALEPLDYTIVVPSRRRVHNIPRIRKLLPTAVICVDERERDDYAPFVPKSQLLIHPPMMGLASVINWMQRKITSDILIEIDDDLRRVSVTTGSHRHIDDPDEILAILENSARCCKDLGLTTFCFSRTPNTTIIHPAERPIVPVQSVCNAFGVMGDARRRFYNPDFLGRADVDWALQTLLEDRCVYADIRFYFDCGKVFSGRGGNVGLIDKAQFNRASVGIREKWGKHVSYRAPAFSKNRSTEAIRIDVKRTNPTAQR